MAFLIHNISELMWSPGIYPNWASGVRELGANQGWGCVDTILIVFSCPTEGSLHNQEPREASLCLIMLNVSQIHQPWTKAAPASGSLAPPMSPCTLLCVSTRGFSSFLILHLLGAKGLWAGDYHRTSDPSPDPHHCVLWTAPPTVRQSMCRPHGLFFANSFTPSIIVVLIVK